MIADRPCRAGCSFCTMSSNRARQSGQRPQGGIGWTLQHRPQTARRRSDTGYSGAAQRPLTILIFLFPLIIAYEVGSRLYLSSAETASGQTIRAHSVILGFFQDFGIVGRFIPAIALITVLVVWHVINADGWRVRLRVLGGMGAE